MIEQIQEIVEKEKKSIKRKEYKEKRTKFEEWREEEEKIKIKNNFYIESSRSLNACDRAHEGVRESFRDKMNF